MPRDIASEEWRYVAPRAQGGCGEIVAARGEAMPDGTPVEMLIASVMPQGTAEENGRLLCVAARHHADLLALAQTIVEWPESPTSEQVAQAKRTAAELVAAVQTEVTDDGGE